MICIEWMGGGHVRISCCKGAAGDDEECMCMKHNSTQIRDHIEWAINWEPHQNQPGQVECVFIGSHNNDNKHNSERTATIINLTKDAPSLPLSLCSPASSASEKVPEWKVSYVDVWWTTRRALTMAKEKRSSDTQFKYGLGLQRAQPAKSGC